MKRIAWILLAGVILVGAAQAAYVEMSAPEKLTVGETLEVTGSSLGTIKPGFSTDLIFYKIAGTKTEIDRTRVVFQEGGVFSASFPTAGLEGGEYLLELVDPKPGGEDAFGGESKNQRNVELIDRQSELKITSPLTQPFTGILAIRGSLQYAGNNGTELTVVHGGRNVYGPLYIATLDGVFSTDVLTPEGGTYDASFRDSKSYIGSAQFMVSQPVPVTTATTVTTPAEQISASAQASRSQPAYFSVRTKPGTVTISTTTGIDWVMEYLDEDSHLTVVNEKGTIGGESATFPTKGGTVYVKVYPFTFSDQGTITLAASNAYSVTVCTNCISLFTTTPVPTTTKESPVPAFLALLALALLVMARRR
jgi:MYXO-CTERM domain-containing protein